MAARSSDAVVGHKCGVCTGERRTAGQHDRSVDDSRSGNGSADGSRTVGWNWRLLVLISIHSFFSLIFFVFDFVFVITDWLIRRLARALVVAVLMMGSGEMGFGCRLYCSILGWNGY